MSKISEKRPEVFDVCMYSDVSWVKPGAMCVLVGLCDEGEKGQEMDYYLQRGTDGVRVGWDVAEEYGDCKRYHGRLGLVGGTTYLTSRLSKYAFGLREILSVDVLGDDADGAKNLRVTLGEDLHPEWD